MPGSEGAATMAHRLRKYYWRLRADVRRKLSTLRYVITHRGDARYCNVCGWRGSLFLPDEPDDPDRKCPLCASLPRQRLLKHTLDLLGLPRPGNRVLHVSPKGERRLAKWLKSRAGDYLSIDKGGVWNTFEAGGAMEEMDLTALRLPDDSVDFVLCSHVLECIPDDRKAISEIFRVLAPGGVAALQVQLYGETTVRVAEPKGEDYWHAWHPGRDYFRRYEGAGFSVDLYEAGRIDDGRLRLYPASSISICRKPRP